MGHHQSRPLVPDTDFYGLPVVRHDPRLRHRQRGEVPQFAQHHAPPNFEPLQDEIDSFGPSGVSPKTHDRSPRSCDCPDQVRENITTLSFLPSDAIATSSTDTTLTDTGSRPTPQAAFSRTCHDMGLLTDIQAPPQSRTRDSFGVGEQSRDNVVALELLRTWESEEEEQLKGQLAFDHSMALQLQQEEDSRYAAESQPRSRECAVCCESFHPLGFPPMPPSTECTHTAQVCSPCLQQWVATRIDANARAAIDCPQCTTRLNHEDVRRACNFETFARYDKFATLSVVDNLQDFHWCLRTGCTGGQEHVGGDLGYMKCHSCNYEQCLQHKTGWHFGESCREYDTRVKGRDDQKMRDQEERKTARFMDEQQIKTVWKKCPKCQVLVEKNGGCDQIKCRMENCQQIFCWECLATWEAMLEHKAEAHAVNCKYRTSARYPYRYV